MLENIASRIKLTLMIALFFAPVFAAVWNKQLDEWMRQNHRYNAPPQASAQINPPKAVNAAK